MKTLLTIYFYFNKIFRSNSCDFYKIKSWLFTLGMIALGTTVGWGQTTVCLDNTDSWEGVGLATNTTGQGCGGEKYIFNNSDDMITSPIISNPQTLTFQKKRSGNNTSWSMDIKISTGFPHTTFTSVSTINSISNNCQTETIDLSSYPGDRRIRMIDTRSSGAHERTISDIKVTCSTPSGSSTVTFNPNGGTGTMPSQTASSTTALTMNSFTQSGCTFSYWSTNADGTGITFADGENYDFSNDITLYAQWNCGGGGGCSTTYTETFEDIPENSSSYSDRTWTGIGGTWSATKARTDQTLNSTRAICTDGSGSILSPNFTDGIGTLTFDYVRAFTGTGSRSFTVWINSTQFGGITTVSSNSNIVQTYSEVINIPGNVQIEIRTSGKQIIVDDLSWTCYSPAPSCTHTLTDFTPANGPEGTIVTVTGTGFTNTSTVSFNGITATTTFINPTTLQAVVPSGAETGEITVTESSCDVLSSSDFTVNITSGTCATSSGDYEILIWNGGIEDWDNADNYLSLSGVIPNNTAWVIGCGSGAASGTGNPASNTIHYGFNEDERIVLYKNSVALDRFGTTGTNNWMTTNKNYSRNATVSSPTATYLSGEWTINPYSASLGSHTFNQPLSDLVISEVADPNSGNNHYIEIYNGTGAPINLENSVNVLPTITTQPTVSNSCTASFNVSATAGNGGSLTYQWYYQDNNGGVWTPVSANSPANLTVLGFNTNSLIISDGSSSTSTINNYQFYCVVTEDDCSVYSNAVQFHFEAKRYYRSIASGNWTTVSNWEATDVLAGPWLSACTYPTAANSSMVFIENGTTIQLDIDNDVDYLEIKNGGTLETLPLSQLAINDSTAGADFIIDGTFIYRSNSSHSFNFNTDATWSLGTNARFVKTNNGVVTSFRDNYDSGISNIPATAQWIYRYNGDGNPVNVTVDMYYPNLRFENTSVTPYTTNASASFDGSTSTAIVKGNLEIGTTGNSTYILHNNNDYSNPILVMGNLSIGTGSELTNVAIIPNSEGTGIELRGNLTVEGSFNLLSGTTERVLKLTGTTNQTVSGIGAVNLYKIEVNKVSGNVFLNRNLQAQDELEMNNGHIYTNSNTLELGLNSSQKGTLTYGNGYVIGKMKRWFNGINAGNTSSLFPMGYDESGLKNRFAKIEYTTAPTTGGDLTVEFIYSDMTYTGLVIPSGNSGGFGSDITNAEDQGYWTCTAGSLSGGTYTSSFTGEGFTEIVSLADITLLKRPNISSPWTAPGFHIPASGTTSLPTVSRSGLTGFSDFGFGSRNIDNPLPIELTSISAICDDKNESLIQWTTATETNNDYFVIEKSTDGKEWNLVEEIQGKGNYSFPSNYSIKDRNTSNFVTYYRLTQVDFNGDTETFHPISLVCQATGVDFQVFPNPANDFTTVSLQGYNFQNATLDLRTIEGKLIQRNLVLENANSIHLNVNLNGLSQGIYLLHWTDGDGEKEVRKIVVK